MKVAVPAGPPPRLASRAVGEGIPEGRLKWKEPGRRGDTVRDRVNPRSSGSPEFFLSVGCVAQLAFGCPLAGRARPPRRASRTRPLIGKDYPLSLSISLSGGEETNQDFPSNGERTGKSPACKSWRLAPRVVVWRRSLCGAPGPSSLERDVIEGDNPVRARNASLHEDLSASRAVWECSPKREVNSFQG